MLGIRAAHGAAMEEMMSGNDNPLGFPWEQTNNQINVNEDTNRECQITVVPAGYSATWPDMRKVLVHICKVMNWAHDMGVRIDDDGNLCGTEVPGLRRHLYDDNQPAVDTPQ